jgi:quinohemoprotein ethanol dehydrogenase
VQKFRGAQGVDNLYTCSILAVDLTTGLLKWHFQTTPNDNWDFDSVQQLMLLDLTIKGKQRKVITQASKNGFFWVLDRVTGEFISGAPFVKTNWASGLDAKGRPIVNPEAYYDTEPISLFPTGGGAHNWSPMSYNPATGYVYISVSLQPFTYAATKELAPGATGYAFGGTSNPKPIGGPAIGPPSADGMRGALQAWDPVNQKLVWRIEGGGGIGGGTVATAGNLVFQSINDGRFRAVTADKGEILYEIQTGRTGMAPPITYEADGKQYVAFQGGLGRPAITVGPNDAKIDNPPMMFVFALDGNAEMPKPAPPPAPPAKPQPPAPGAAPELQPQ